MISLPFLQTPITSAPVLPVLLNEKKPKNQLKHKWIGSFHEEM